MSALLTRSALRRVLQSLISATRRVQALRTSIPAEPWADEFVLAEGEAAALGCDSLDLLQIATAVNEMFHLHEAHLEAELLHRFSFGEWIGVVEEAWRRGVQNITVTTSGSSGRPKPCSHSFAALNIEIDYLAMLFAKASRIVAFTPAHHVYGLLFTAMLPDKLAIPVQHLQSPACPDGGAPDNNTVLRSGDLVVSFPDGWRWIDQNIRTVPPGVEGVVSTAPCPRDLIRSLSEERFGGFTEIYGSSETAGIGTRRWPDNAYTLMPQWQRFHSASQSCEQLSHTMGFHAEVMDHLNFIDDPKFLLGGRKDCGVQVGGVNVFPTVIAERLRTHPGVANATVRLMRPEEGQRLKCFVVPQTNHSVEELEMNLRSWIDTWPTVAERPKALTLGTALPLNEFGKAVDW